MKLDVPFIPDPEYTDFLATLGERIHAVHFSLYDPELSDARIRVRSVGMQTIDGLLRKLPGPKKYLLANARFQPPDRYGTDGGTADLLHQLSYLLSSGVLDGIIFSDGYLLLALSDAAPDLARRLEAVPSVNFNMDTIQKIQPVLDMIQYSRFRMPGKIALDRDLNRNPKAVSDLSRALRKRYPQAKLELLVNEGCLPRCPFRQTHEALIASANAGLAVNAFTMNRDLGCLRMLSRAPHRILSSPFIRPEDIHRYREDADIFKICGRTLGKDFLMRAIKAYTEERFEGNLFDLLDASHWMGEKWELRNPDLPEDFFERMTGCRQDCDNCPVCEEMFARLGRRRPFHLPDFNPSQ
ncbi:MAG: hypothetical protein P8Z73_14010 [Desulfobacteraceae bacterium]